MGGSCLIRGQEGRNGALHAEDRHCTHLVWDNERLSARTLSKNDLDLRICLKWLFGYRVSQ